MDCGHDMIDVPMDCPMLRSDWVGCLPCLFTRCHDRLHKEEFIASKSKSSRKAQADSVHVNLNVAFGADPVLHLSRLHYHRIAGVQRPVESSTRTQMPLTFTLSCIFHRIEQTSLDQTSQIPTYSTLSTTSCSLQSAVSVAFRRDVIRAESNRI
ncbi:hypothetical protein BDW66DRAFT_7884 [Aspergillus desertorum]